MTVILSAPRREISANKKHEITHGLGQRTEPRDSFGANEPCSFMKQVQYQSSLGPVTVTRHAPLCLSNSDDYRRYSRSTRASETPEEGFAQAKWSESGGIN